ncbi:hypothetical protein OG937_38380 [Streptomyces sp. NBC_00510]
MQMTLSNLDAVQLRAWHQSLTAQLGPMVASFEAIHGYPPGDNEITLAGPGHRMAARELSGHSAVPPSLVAFYSVIGDVSLGDVGNGYFIHSPENVLEELTREGPAYSSISCDQVAVVFASDGGGSLFAIDRQGVVCKSQGASRDVDFVPAAQDLVTFLDLLSRSVTDFIATGQAGHA